MRCGASSSTHGARFGCQGLHRVLRARSALEGRKPANTKPTVLARHAGHAQNAAVMLLAPGSGTTRRPAARTAATRRAPGSLTPGVPASLT